MMLNKNVTYSISVYFCCYLVSILHGCVCVSRDVLMKTPGIISSIRRKEENLDILNYSRFAMFPPGGSVQIICR